MTRPHTTHHESCGCCEAERDALKAQVERLREAINSASHELRLYGDPGPFAKRILDAALAASPAQSLAAHDAEVRAQALREAAEAVGLMHDSGFASDYAVAILALAERAPKVER